LGTPKKRGLQEKEEEGHECETEQKKERKMVITSSGERAVAIEGVAAISYNIDCQPAKAG
jgi:hypothetical protein